MHNGATHLNVLPEREQINGPFKTNPSLNLAVVAPGQRPIDQAAQHRIELALGQLLSRDDSWAVVPVEQAAEFDAAIVWAPCGPSPAVSRLCSMGVPLLPLSPALCFHPFHAALERDAEKRRGLLLSSHTLAEIQGSIQALRARKRLAGARLLVLNDHQRDERLEVFARGIEPKTGIELEHLPVNELLKRAASFQEDYVARAWQCLQDEVFNGPGDFGGEGRAHLSQVTRLYLALRELLDECGACGVTVDDIGSFYRRRATQFPEGVMPNCAYGALMDAGYLACEEGDVEVLTSELMLQVAFGEQPTMSNIYLSHRDRFDALENAAPYPPEMQREDFEQCRRDNRLMASHFSTSGLLPRGMRVEPRLQIRETLPSWPGQSMVQATPRLGRVQMARLSEDGASIHHFPGEIVDVKMDDSKGWYRGRYFIQIHSVDDFITKCLHQHYAIGPRSDEAAETAWKMLLRLCDIDEVN